MDFKDFKRLYIIAEKTSNSRKNVGVYSDLDYINLNRQNWDEIPDSLLSKLLNYYFAECYRYISEMEEEYLSVSELMDIYNEYSGVFSPQDRLDSLQSLNLICLKQKEDEMARKNMIGYLFSMFNEMRSDTVNELRETDLVLCSFRPISDYVLKEIENEELSVCSFDKFNDPADCIFPHWINRGLESAKGVAKEQLLMQKSYLNFLRARCFVKMEENDDFYKLSPLMWAHYADSHKGICIRYRFSKDFFVADEDKRKIVFGKPMKYESTFKYGDSIFMSKALLAKSDVWKYENEYRIMLFDPTTNKEYPSIPFDGKVEIVDVHLGIKCSEENRMKIFKLLQNKNISLYQMTLNENFSFEFEAKRIV